MPPPDEDEPSSFTIASPKVQMAFACENISTDTAGRVSFVNIIDALTALSFPTTTPQLFVVFGFVGQLAGFLLKPRVAVEDSEKNRVFEAQLKDMALTADSPVTRAIIGIQGLQWPHPGQYVVKFIANGDRVLASFPVTLAQAQLPGLPGSPMKAP